MRPDDENNTLFRNVDKLILRVVKKAEDCNLRT